MLRPAPRTHTRTHVLALTLTHTRAHAHAAGPRAHRPAAAIRITISTPRFFFFKFQFAFAGLPHPQPPCPEESKHFSRQDLSGVVGSSCGEERGLTGLAPASRLSPGADPGTLRAAAGARVPGGARVRTEAVGVCLRGAPRAPRPAPEAQPGLRRPGPAACGKEVYFVLRAELGTWRGAPCAALPPPSPALPLLLGPRRGMGCLWEFGVPRRWEPILGRPCLTRWGRGRVGECSLLPGAPQTECRRTGESVGVWPSHLIPASLLPTHAHSAPPRNL